MHEITKVDDEYEEHLRKSELAYNLRAVAQVIDLNDLHRWLECADAAGELTGSLHADSAEDLRAYLLELAEERWRDHAEEADRLLAQIK